MIPHICSLVNSHILPFPPHFKQWVHDHIFYSQEQVKYVLFTPCVLILTPFYMYSHHPDELHRIHRVPFLPAIDILKSPFSIQDLDSGTEVLNAVWPCTAFHAHVKDLREQLTRACVHPWITPVLPSRTPALLASLVALPQVCYNYLLPLQFSCHRFVIPQTISQMLCALLNAYFPLVTWVHIFRAIRF